jgi:molybdopterin synthase sulfur carrier subunit
VTAEPRPASLPAMTVRIPTILRTYTGGAAAITASGSTVGDVLAAVDHAHPGIRARLVDETGVLRRFVNIYIDDDDIRFGEGLDTPVADGSTLSIIPAVAGG